MQVNVSCPDCSRQLRLPEEVMGQSVRCPLCKVVFKARHPDAKPPASPAWTPAEDDLPLLPLVDDDEPPRRERREERPRRPAREREERDDRRPARRPSPTRGFALFVHRDPHDKLAGEFKAEFDADGLTFWRGRGREIVVPFGSAAEYLGDGRILLEIEGRKVEASPVHRDGLNDELARAVLDALGGSDEPFRMPLLPRGKVVWLALLPLALPLLAWAFGDDVAGLGGVISFSVLGVVLMGVALIFVMQRRMAAATRAWTALGLALGGFLVLGIALRVDHSGPPEPPLDFSHWIAFAPIDGGFSAEFPGLPENVANFGINPPPVSNALTNRYSVEIGGKTNLIAGYGVAANGPAALQEFGPGRATLYAAQILSQRPLAGDGPTGVEVQFKANDGRTGVARYFVKNDRLFGITFVSRKLSPDCTEARRFLDSFAFDPTTGWPGPGTTGLKPIAAAPNMPGIPGIPGVPMNPGIPGFPGVPGIPINPPVDPNQPGTKLGLDGTLLLAHNRNLVWAGYRAKTREVVGVAVEGLVYVCDDSGMKIRQTTLNAGGTVTGAALSPDGKKLAVLGVNNKLILVDADSLKPTTFTPDTRVDVPQGGAAFSPDGKFLATTHGDQKVRIWDVEKKAVVKRFPLDRNQVVSVAFSHDGKELVCGDAGGTLFQIDAKDGRIIGRLKGDFGADLRILAMSADGTVVSGGIDAKLRFWKLPAPTAKAVNGRGNKVTAVAFNPAGRLIAVADALGRLSLFDSATQDFRAAISRVQTGPLNFGQIPCVAFSPSGEKLLVADGPRLECWNISRHLSLPGDLVPVTPRKPSGPSELQDRGKLLEHQFALVCPEKKCALLFTADKKAHRYSYPEWKLTKSSPFPMAVGSAALDVGTGTLYAVEGVGVRPPPKAKNEILAYDVAPLLDNKALPADLEPKRRLAVGVLPRDLLLDASGKSLYYAEGSVANLLVRRVGTAAFDAPETILDKKRYAQLAMSPDRKTLFVLGTEAAWRNPLVVRFDAESGKKDRDLSIPQNLGMAMHPGGGRILLRGRDGLALLDWATSQVTVLSSSRNEPGAWLTPNGTRLYVEGFIPHTLNAYDVPAGTRALPPAAFSMELQEPIRAPTQRGLAPLFSPDGRFLLFPSGRLIGLGKDAKPAEPNPEP